MDNRVMMFGYQPPAVYKAISALEKAGDLGHGVTGPWLEDITYLERIAIMGTNDGILPRQRGISWEAVMPLIIVASYTGDRNTFFSPDRDTAIRRYFAELHEATRIVFKNPHDAGAFVYPVEKQYNGEGQFAGFRLDAISTVIANAVLPKENYAPLLFSHYTFMHPLIPTKLNQPIGQISVAIMQRMNLTPEESKTLEDRLSSYLRSKGIATLSEAWASVDSIDTGMYIRLGIKVPSEYLKLHMPTEQKKQ